MVPNGVNDDDNGVSASSGDGNSVIHGGICTMLSYASRWCLIMNFVQKRDSPPHLLVFAVHY